MTPSSFRPASLQVCGCRGARTCLLCERDEGKRAIKIETPGLALYQCYICGKVGTFDDTLEDHASSLRVCKYSCAEKTAVLEATLVEQQYKDATAPFSGVIVVKEFVSTDEEVAILNEVDAHKWAESQSGRRKQDYGPKVNFKRQKLKFGTFNGLPQFIEPFVKRMRDQIDALQNFIPVELCNLDYRPERGAHIEPHHDDSWLWGERLVTVNLCSPTFLTFSLPLPPTYHPEQDTLYPYPPQDTPDHYPPQGTLQPRIHIPLPRRSLVIVKGTARHVWNHSIEKEHIISRRVGITLRELTNEFLPGGDSADMGHCLLEIAQNFNGQPTN